MHRRSLLVVIVLALVGAGLGWLVGGIRPGGAAGTAGVATPAGGDAGPRHRIICAAPSITEVVFALGRGDDVVAVTDWCVWPPEGIADKERIGGFADPNREAILRLEPDIIIHVGSFEALRQLGADHGIATLSVDMGTLDGIRAGVRRIGRELGCSDRAEAVIRRFDADLEAVRARAALLPTRRTYLCTAHRPGELTGLGTCAAGSFLDELLTAAGGDNIFADAQGNWPQVSKETLVRRAPEVIIELHPAGMGVAGKDFERLRADWRRLPDIPAVRAGAIHFLGEDFLFIPSIRAPRIAALMARALHGKAWDD